MNWFKLLFIIGFFFTTSITQSQENFDVLVFSKTNGFRHESIEVGKQAIKELGLTNGFKTIFSEDSTFFSKKQLKNIDVVIFLNTTGDILNERQQEVLKKFINNGGGFVGIHSASDTEYDWPWYGDLVGCYFQSHPQIQEAELTVINKDHISTQSLPTSWIRTDEWYNFKKPLPEKFNLLVTLDESSYKGGTMGAIHPISWYNSIENGRLFYTAAGHTDESYQETEFLNHILGGILWAAKR